MPSSNVNDQLKRMWASNEGTAIAVNTFEFVHPDIQTTAGENYRVCDFRQVLVARDSVGGTMQTYQPIAMRVELAGVSDNGDQRLRLSLDALDGFIYTQLRALTQQQRNTPIECIHRIYLANSGNDDPQIDPPQRFRVIKVNVGLQSVTMELSAFNLPTKATGIYYTVENFPGVQGR